MAQVIFMDDFALTLTAMARRLPADFSKEEGPEQRSEREIEIACLG